MISPGTPAMPSVGMPQLAAYSSLPSAPSAAQARQVAEGFESLFTYQLLEPLEKSGKAFFGDGPEGRTFGGMFRQVLAEQIAKSRPLGIADRMEEVLLARRSTSEVQTLTPVGNNREGIQ